MFIVEGDSMSTFGQNLKYYRKCKDINQEALAAMVGVKQSTIANYENGNRKPTVDVLIKLSHSLGITINMLLEENWTEDHLIIKKTRQEGKSIEAMGIDLCLEHTILNLLNHLINKREEEVYLTIQNIYRDKGDLLFIFEEVIKPVMVQLGFLWEMGKITILDEHAASEIMARIIDWLAVKHSNPYGENEKKSQTAICLSISPEQHTLGIKMVSIFLADKGYRSICLGNNVPTLSLLSQLESLKADMLILSYTMPEHADAVANLVRVIRHEEPLKGLKILIGGQGISKPNAFVDGIEGAFKSLYELDNWLNLDTK